jgi:hypothetical protein
MLVTKDVPKVYNKGAPLEASSWLTKQATDDPTKAAAAFPINLPIAGGKGYVLLVSSSILFTFNFLSASQADLKYYIIPNKP